MTPEQVIERYGSVEKAAEKAAGWWNGLAPTWSEATRTETDWFLRCWDSRGMPLTEINAKYLSHIELIAEALKAGWEG